MKGLLIKDLYMIMRYWKAMIFFNIMYAGIAAFSEMGMLFAMMNVMLGTMVVKSLIAYEEQNKWDCLAVHLPVTAKQLVLEKYLVGFGAAVFTSILTAAVMMLADLLQDGKKGMLMLPNLMLFVAVGMVMLSLELPVLFKFGVEKGRLWFMAAFVLACGLMGVTGGIVGSVTEASVWQLASYAGVPVAAIFLLTAAAAVWISLKLSVQFYQKREF